MIVNGKKINVEKLKKKVPLGNLTLESCCPYYVDSDPNGYPVAWFGTIKPPSKEFPKGSRGFSLIPDRPENCPEGDYIDKQLDSVEEGLLYYAESIMKEHTNLSDEKINVNPPFIGRKRNARWNDERRRRGLIK